MDAVVICASITGNQRSVELYRGTGGSGCGGAGGSASGSGCWEELDSGWEGGTGSVGGMGGWIREAGWSWTVGGSGALHDEV